MASKKKGYLPLLISFFLTILIIGILEDANAVLINGGFETGDTTGWTLSYGPYGGAFVSTSHPANYITYTPVEGSYLLGLQAGNPGIYTTASQTLTLAGGDKLSGWAAFDAHAIMYSNDNAYVKIYDALGGLAGTPWYYDVSMLWSDWQGDGPWGYWEFVAPISGLYTLSYGVASGYARGYSHALFDAAALTSISEPVPEPSTLLLLGSGLVGLELWRRMRG